MSVETVTREYPQTLVKKRRAQELRSKLVPEVVPVNLTYITDFPPRPTAMFLTLEFGLPDIGASLSDQGLIEPVTLDAGNIGASVSDAGTVS
jgi:hypothetical protein